MRITNKIMHNNSIYNINNNKVAEDDLNTQIATGKKLTSLRVDGGASKNNFLMQFQSDIIDSKVIRPSCVETTALGAAYLAGYAGGFWKDRDDVCSNWAVDVEFNSQMSQEKREKELKGWQQAVASTRGWAKEV